MFDSLGGWLSEAIGYLRELNMVSILFRFFLATVCGGLIGQERGRKQHAAGLRTHVLVCMGAAAAMLINQYILMYIDVNSDPARLGAQVISGIGFLGAGTIMITGHRQGQQVKGLTTAAGLWASACMGLAIGVGFYEGAIIMCAFLLIVLVILNRIDDRYLKTGHSMQLFLEYDPEIPLSSLLIALRQYGWHMSSIQVVSNDRARHTAVLLDIYRFTRVTHENDVVIQQLRSVEGVFFVETL